LDAQNRERQNIERRIAKEVIEALKVKFDPARDFALVVGDAGWHIGVVGIVASRVVREFYRPAIVVGGDLECWRGSGRSIQGVDLADALRDCHDLLLRHGGHAMAAGLSILPENLPLFRERLNRSVQERLRPEQMEPALRIDLETSLGELTLQCMRELEKLEPIGQENPAPHFLTRRLRLVGNVHRIGTDRKHARFVVTDGRENRDAIWWNFGDLDLLRGTFDLGFSPRINSFREPRVQLQVLDVQPSGEFRP
jgi:single-stranded-DNA-specific exonuclease